jgi:hypothetical protein
MQTSSGVSPGPEESSSNPAESEPETSDDSDVSGGHDSLSILVAISGGVGGSFEAMCSKGGMSKTHMQGGNTSGM